MSRLLSVWGITNLFDRSLQSRRVGASTGAKHRTPLNLERLEGRILLDADLAISKSASVDVVIAGEELFYDIRVHNFGPDTAQDVEVTDEMPDGLSFLGDTASGGCVLDVTTVT